MKKKLRDYYKGEYWGAMVDSLLIQAQADGVTELEVLKEELIPITYRFGDKPDWDMKVWGIQLKLGKLSTEERIEKLTKRIVDLENRPVCKHSK